jgi:hypothetical protein
MQRKAVIAGNVPFHQQKCPNAKPNNLQISGRLYLMVLWPVQLYGFSVHYYKFISLDYPIVL